MQLLPMASSSEGLISARDAVITKTPGREVLTTTRNVNVSGGGGGGDPKVCVPKRAQSDFPNRKFRLFPRWSLWSGGGGVTPRPPAVYGPCNTSMPPPPQDAARRGEGRHRLLVSTLALAEE